MRLARDSSGNFEVRSDNGKLLSSHSTLEAAKKWMKQYSSYNKYSNDANKIGTSNAIKILRQRINSKI